MRTRNAETENMPTVKLIGGFADGSIALVADGQDVIYVPRQWGRQGYQGKMSRSTLSDMDDMERYVRSGQFDPDGVPLFVAESAPGLLG